MGINLSIAEKRQLRSSGGALVLPLPGATGQPKRVYYDAYGDAHRFPSDAWSLEHYMLRGYTLKPPVNPLKREEADLIGAESWDGKKQESDEPEAVISGPVATYYTPDGTAVPNLSADPESMAAYLSQGLTLSRPAGAVVEKPERPHLRVVEPERERRQPRRRRFARKTG